MDHTIIALRKQDFKSVCMWLGIANKMREEEKKTYNNHKYKNKIYVK